MMSHKLPEMDGQTSARHAFVVIRIANRLSSKRRSWQIRKRRRTEKREKKEHLLSPFSAQGTRRQLYPFFFKGKKREGLMNFKLPRTL